MSSARRTILVAGALGVVGRAVVERFAARADATVIALARRASDFAPQATWISVDLRDAAATRAALAAHPDVTHLVYAALHEQADLLEGWRAQANVDLNTAMLRHTLDALAGAPLAHVTLLQGTKAYGVHTGRAMRVPARETDAVRDHANFYFDQQDLVAARGAATGFDWTIFRPQIVLGVAVGSAIGYRPGGGVLGVAAAVLLAMLAGWSLAWIFTLFGIVGRNAAGVQGISLLVMFPLTFLSNAFVPTDTMPEPLQTFAEVNPVSLVITAIRDLANEGAVTAAVGAVLGVTPSTP